MVELYLDLYIRSFSYPLPPTHKPRIFGQMVTVYDSPKITSLSRNIINMPERSFIHFGGGGALWTHYPRISQCVALLLCMLTTVCETAKLKWAKSSIIQDEQIEVFVRCNRITVFGNSLLLLLVSLLSQIKSLKIGSCRKLHVL